MTDNAEISQPTGISAATEAQMSLFLTEITGQDPNRWRIVQMDGDASTRSYFRAYCRDGSTIVLTRYPEPGIADLASFLDVHGFLNNHGLPVPEILAVSREKGLIALEDLGDRLLETIVQHADSDEICRLYTEAVDLLQFMRRATGGKRSGCVAFRLAFDMEKLMQEMKFFSTHFIKGLCRIDHSDAAAETLDRFFTRICSILADEPRILAHRDYHSRNLMLHRDRLFMIDFQDARMGPAQYDLASLLRDSYVTLPEELVESLLERYRQGMDNGARPSRERFRYVFDVMSLQRNIKALGTFGYQVSVRGSRRYLSSIPRTARYVAENIKKYGEFAEYKGIVDDVISGPAVSITNIFEM